MRISLDVSSEPYQFIRLQICNFLGSSHDNVTGGNDAIDVVNLW